jgi:hypothetical protein
MMDDVSKIPPLVCKSVGFHPGIVLNPNWKPIRATFTIIGSIFEYAL